LFVFCAAMAERDRRNSGCTSRSTLGAVFADFCTENGARVAPMPKSKETTLLSEKDSMVA
jgi:hypothetical protein